MISAMNSFDPDPNTYVKPVLSKGTKVHAWRSSGQRGLNITNIRNARESCPNGYGTSGICSLQRHGSLRPFGTLRLLRKYTNSAASQLATYEVRQVMVYDVYHPFYFRFSSHAET